MMMPSRSEIAEQVSKKLGVKVERFPNFAPDMMIWPDGSRTGCGPDVAKIWDALISASVELEELRARQEQMVVAIEDACMSLSEEKLLAAIFGEEDYLERLRKIKAGLENALAPGADAEIINKEKLK